MTETSPLPTDLGTPYKLLERAYTGEDAPWTSEKEKSLELLTVTAVQMASGLQMVWRANTQEGSVWETGSYLSRMRFVEFLASTTVDFLTRTEEILSPTREKHLEWVVPQTGAEVGRHLEPAQEIALKSRQLLQWLNRERPPVQEDTLRRSRESLDRGEGEALNDILARVGNGGPLVQE